MELSILYTLLIRAVGSTSTSTAVHRTFLHCILRRTVLRTAVLVRVLFSIKSTVTMFLNKKRILVVFVDGSFSLNLKKRRASVSHSFLKHKNVFFSCFYVQISFYRLQTTYARRLLITSI